MIKKLIGIALAFTLLCATAVCEEEDIQVDHVQAVAVGDSSNELTSEGENASDYSEDSSDADKQSEDTADFVRLTFDEGFSMSFPSGWKYYEITDEMRASGVIYALSSADGTRQSYIQLWDTECTDIDSLNTVITNTSSPQTSGVHEFNSVPFIVYDLPHDDVSCAAALLNGKVLNIVFTPQSDSEYMLTAAKIMQSFTLN